MTIGQLTNRAVIRVSPRDDSEDVVAFLQGLLTNDLMSDGPVYAGLLTPQGKTMFDMIVWRTGDVVWLDCEAGKAEELVKRLSLYRLRRKIDIAIDPQMCVVWNPSIEDHAGPDPRLPEMGSRWLVSGAEDAESADDQYLAHRLSLGVAEGSAELGDILWLETNAVDLNGVSFGKGCYIGQENTARMNWRQKVNRRLVVVPLARSDEKRRKAAYPELGYAVDHLRVDAIPQDLVPGWMTLSDAS